MTTGQITTVPCIPCVLLLHQLDGKRVAAVRIIDKKENICISSSSFKDGLLCQLILSRNILVMLARRLGDGIAHRYR